MQKHSPVLCIKVAEPPMPPGGPYQYAPESCALCRRPLAEPGPLAVFLDGTRRRVCPSCTGTFARPLLAVVPAVPEPPAEESPRPGGFIPPEEMQAHRDDSAADLFGVTLRAAPGLADTLRPFLGMVNAEEFQGRPPGTVRCVGFDEGEATAEVTFLFRPQGLDGRRVSFTPLDAEGRRLP